MLFNRDGLLEIWRYYQVGILNTAFGFAAYSILVWLGINLYVAQAIAHVAGVAFNYFTYSRHVFRNRKPAKARFIVSYGLNYFASLATLFFFYQITTSPYLAGVATIIIISIANYFLLKIMVFRSRPT